jgi:hypothetical protein
VNKSAITTIFVLLFALHACSVSQTVPPPAYEVVTARYSEHNVGELGCDIEIPYPQVSGLADASLQSRINAKLLTVFLGLYMSSWQWDGFDTITCEYEIKHQDDTLLSIVNDSNVYVARTAHPTYFAFAVNIDMQTGEILPLEKLFDVDEVTAALANCEFEVAFSVNDLMDYITFEEIAKRYSWGISSFDYGHQYDYYVDGDKLGLIVGLPHGLGDFAIFERSCEALSGEDGSYSEISDYAEPIYINPNPVVAKTEYKLRYSYGEGFRECAVALDVAATDATDVYELSVQPDLGERIIIGAFRIDGDNIWKLDDDGAETRVCSAQDSGEYGEYNSAVETGFYERIVWQRGVGLAEYVRGFGAERDLVELIRTP